MSIVDALFDGPMIEIIENKMCIRDSFLASQCLLTEVLISPGGGGLDQRDGMAVVGASPETAAEALSYIEI